MTGEEYIELTKTLIPLKDSSYINSIKVVFDLFTTHFYSHNRISQELELKVIASTSFFCEFINTQPKLTLIWDRYQWSLAERLLVASLMYENVDETLAIDLLKLNLFLAFSFRLTNISPELSYIFAIHYKSILNNLPPTTYRVEFEHFYDDLLYCELLTLGHEFSHIIIEKDNKGKEKYKKYEKVFLSNINKMKKMIDSLDLCQNSKYYDILFNDIQSDYNKKFREELICDICSYDMMRFFIKDLEKIITEERIKTVRNEGRLFSDILSLNRCILSSLESFTIILDFVTRIGNIGTTHRCLKIDDIHCYLPNLHNYSQQYKARDFLINEYIKMVYFRNRKIDITKDNSYLNTSDTIIEMYKKLLFFEDTELLSIFKDFCKILHFNIPKETLISARDSVLEINSNRKK